MDGQFVPNLTFGAKVIQALRARTSLPIDVHLMVVEPENYFDDFARAGATIMTIHTGGRAASPPAVDAHPGTRDARAGVALNPATPLNAVCEVLPSSTCCSSCR